MISQGLAAFQFSSKILSLKQGFQIYSASLIYSIKKMPKIKLFIFAATAKGMPTDGRQKTILKLAEAKAIEISDGCRSGNRGTCIACPVDQVTMEA